MAILQYFLCLDFSRWEEDDGVVEMQDFRMQLELAPPKIGAINKVKNQCQNDAFSRRKEKLAPLRRAQRNMKCPRNIQC